MKNTIKNSVMAICAATMLAGCATPAYVLEHPETKQVHVVGGTATGSMAGGMIGYHIQKGTDQEKIESLKEQGFVVKEVKP